MKYKSKFLKLKEQLGGAEINFTDCSGGIVTVDGRPGTYNNIENNMTNIKTTSINGIYRNIAVDKSNICANVCKDNKFVPFFSFDEECKNNIKDKINKSCETVNINKYCEQPPQLKQEQPPQLKQKQPQDLKVLNLKKNRDGKNGEIMINKNKKNITSFSKECMQKCDVDNQNNIIGQCKNPKVGENCRIFYQDYVNNVQKYYDCEYKRDTDKDKKLYKCTEYPDRDSFMNMVWSKP